jgi:hypothetical protein
MANLSQAILLNSSLNGCELLATDLTDACLIEADLQRANLQLTMCQRSDLSAANLTYARLVATNLTEAILDDAIVYGSAVWDVNLNGTRQRRLLISKHDEPTITVDDLEVAQFLYLLLDRRKFRNVIDTITSKVVLILGRFTPERKAVLDAIANELRKHNFVPVIFDFERSTGRDFTETVRTLVGLSLFVIVDITNPKSSPLELQATVPDYQVPFVPIIQKGEDPFSMFRDLSGKYDWVLNPLIYANTDNLIHGFRKAIIDRAWKKHQQLQKRKAEGVEALSIDEYLRG